MEGNGNGHPIGSFEYYLASRLLRLESSGMAKEAIQGLRERAGQITQALINFRATKQQATESGRFSPAGLAEKIGEAAATAAGEIRKFSDDSGLRDNMKQLRAKLALTTNADQTTALINFWRRMELRTLYQQQGLTLIDVATGQITYDTVKADLLYQEALATGNHEACQALEEWPLRCPVNPELVSRGQAARLGERDPVVAKKLKECEELHAAMIATERDSMVELKEFLPVFDPLAEKATRNEFAE